MPIRIRRGWEIAENRVTPESFVLGRRAALAGLAAGAAGLGIGGRALAQAVPRARPWGR